jgi:AcrR family transcriptional regulator
MPDARDARVGWGTVVTVGSRMIRDKGIVMLDLGELANELAVPPTAVSYWFQEPGQLLVAVMEMRQNWFLDEARARMAPLERHTDRLHEFIDLSVADYDSAFWIELWRLSSSDEGARRSRQSLTDAYRRTIAGIIRAGQRAGEFGPASPDKVALVLAALIAGFSVNATLGDPAVSQDIMLKTLLDACERLLDVELSA